MWSTAEETLLKSLVFPYGRGTIGWSAILTLGMREDVPDDARFGKAHCKTASQLRGRFRMLKWKEKRRVARGNVGGGGACAGHDEEPIIIDD